MPSTPPSSPAPPVLSLCRLLLAASDPDPGPDVHPQLRSRPADADAVLERALLRVWRLLRDPHSGQPPQHLLVRSFGPRGWRRLGLLLFSTSHQLVAAAVALLQAALCPSAGGSNPAHIRVIRPSSADDPRELRTAWVAVLDSACDKLRDCLNAQLELETGQRAVATGLVRLAGSAIAFSAVNLGSFDGQTDRLDVRHALELLHELATREPSHYMHLAALRELLALQEAVEELPTSLLPDPLLQHFLSQLATSFAATHAQPVDSVHIQCCRLYLELLANTPSFTPPVDAALTISEGLLSSPDASLQLSTLQWLTVQLNVDHPEHTEALTRAVRLAGTLRSLSWLLLHSQRPVREQTAVVLSKIQSFSPPADLARTLIEQGCVAILRVVVEQVADSSDPGGLEAARLIDWARRELGDRPFLVRSCCHSVQHSTNTSLRVNIVLALHILRGSDGDSKAVDGIRTALQDENFLDDVLLPAINDVEHEEEAGGGGGGGGGGFAKALLGLLVNTCDPLSMLKLERGLSRRNSSVSDGSDALSDSKESALESDG